MYLCTGGKVTVGVGHSFERVEDALKLPFSQGVLGRPATPEEIRRDFAAVAAAPRGYKASWYAQLTNCRLASAAIDNLVDEDIAAVTAALRSKFPQFDTFPQPVQEAVFDMAFNLGIGTLMEFKNLRAALDARDFVRAAAESHRRGISEDRNAETAALFEQGVEA